MNYNSNYNDDNAFKSQCFALILNAYVCSVLSYINNYNVNNVNNNVNNVNNNDADTGGAELMVPFTYIVRVNKNIIYKKETGW